MLKSIAHRGVLLIFVLLVVACEGKTYEDGVAAYDDKDFVKSLRIWKPLAEQGDVRAQIRIALDLYDLGQKGIPRDRVRGTAWLLKAAEQDHTYAQRVMGVRYEGGVGCFKRLRRGCQVVP